jgi:hypothetical protein
MMNETNEINQNDTSLPSDEVNNGTTTFIDEGSSVTVGRTDYLSIPKFQLSTGESSMQSISDFLKKPIVIYDSSISTATTGLLYDEDCTRNVYTGGTTLWDVKLRNIYGLKFKSVFTMKINGSRFDQGMVSMSFMPTGGYCVNTQPYDPANRIYAFSKTQLTTMQHVNFNINCDSSAILEIPWISAYPFLKLIPYTDTRAGTPGFLKIWVYSPLVTESSDPVRITVWQHLEDVEYFGNTVTQSGSIDIKRIRHAHVTLVQAGRARVITRKDALTQEEQSTKPISGGLRMLSSISSALSVVPLLSTFTEPISWVTDAMSKAAYIWGYSAPRMVSPPNFMVRNKTPYISNYDKHAPAYSMGLSVANKVGPAIGFSGTDNDEMSVDYLKQIFAYTNFFTYTAAQTDEQLIFTYDLSPISGRRTIVAPGAFGGSYVYTPAAFLSRIYQKWRGSIKLRFILVKTEFHRGRLAFAYSPNGGTPTYDQTDPLLREIVDIRAGSVIEITIPFISNLHWLDNTANMGKLHVYKIDDLKTGGDQAPTNVNVLVEMCMGEDAQFNIRSNIRMSPNGQTGTFQSAGDSIKQCEAVVTRVGDSSQSPKDYSHTVNCIGEAAESLSQIVKAGGFCTGVSSRMGMGSAHAVGFRVTSPSSFNDMLSVDILGSITSCYAQMRGAVRLTFITSRPSEAKNYVVWLVPDSAFLHPILAFQADITDPVNQITFLNNTGLNFFNENETALSLDFPGYCELMSSPVASNMINSTGLVVAKPGGFISEYRIRCLGTYTEGEDKLLLHRAGADDYRVGNFICIPVMWEWQPNPGA